MWINKFSGFVRSYIQFSFTISMVVFVFIGFSFFQKLFADETKDEEVELLQWEPLEHAQKYKLEVKDEDDDLVISTELEGTKYAAKLTPGNYSHRVGVIGKTGKVLGWSGWVDFTVIRSVLPEIEIKEVLFGTRNQVPSLWSVFWRSAVFPGWGQRYRDEKWKGYIFPALLIVTAGAYAKTYSDFLKARTEYNDAVNLNLVLPQDSSSQLFSLINYTRTQGNYSNAGSNLNLIRNASIGLVAVYIYNLIDIFLFHDYSGRQVSIEDPEMKFFLQTVQTNEGSRFMTKNQQYEFGMILYY
ncbi:MAG: hypothetical protein K8R21_02635 [Leptospira sp.]|nr:hypothetical protein [Leptospira sp.]